MTRKAFDKIAEGLNDAIAYAEGAREGYGVHVPETIDVKAIREGLGLTQQAFAARYGFKVSALREWEQNRRSPDTTARILLKVILKEPEAVRRALAS